MLVSLQRCPGYTFATCCFLHGHQKHFGSMANMPPTLNLLHPQLLLTDIPRLCIKTQLTTSPPPPPHPPSTPHPQVKTSSAHQVRDRWALLPHTSQLRKEMQMKASAAIQKPQVAVAAAASERASDKSLAFG